MTKKRLTVIQRERRLAKTISRELSSRLMAELRDHTSYASARGAEHALRELDNRLKLSFGWVVLKLITNRRDARIAAHGEDDVVAAELAVLFHEVDEARKLA